MTGDPELDNRRSFLTFVRKLAPIAGALVLLAFLGSYVPGGLSRIFRWIEDHSEWVLAACFAGVVLWQWRRKR